MHLFRFHQLPIQQKVQKYHQQTQNDKNDVEISATSHLLCRTNISPSQQQQQQQQQKQQQDRSRIPFSKKVKSHLLPIIKYVEFI
ncbi:unnamed protein product [Didymodactylos carnosus]|uniref:Uncharacterized protein n=1 Tax=Didymodactylos carnosus TaxID=1234261 RepID=A0A814HVE1_9BILA|nr:unnamed protein product [Didymodactylos carnosus]CAF3787100.1 unnamed protein product [Didymodactylos carnosus]